MPDRPLSRRGIDALEHYARVNPFSLEALKEVQHELRFRRSVPKQSALRDWVDDRVEVFGETVVHGSSPLDEPEIVDLLGWYGIQYRGTYRTDVESLIIG